jgi:glutaredoxin
MTRARLAGALIALASAACAVQAQELYRWTDTSGGVHVTDTPPPADARAMETVRGGVSTGAGGAAGSATAPVPYELAIAMKDYPIVLYTTSNCQDACTRARGALNRRGAPFREVQVLDQRSGDELKRVSGGTDVPTLLVGKSVQRGFEQSAFDSLLDAARYPKAGVLPPRSQAAPAAQAQAKPAEPAAQPEEPRGPYSPGSSRPPLRGPQTKP